MEEEKKRTEIIKSFGEDIIKCLSDEKGKPAHPTYFCYDAHKSLFDVKSAVNINLISSKTYERVNSKKVLISLDKNLDLLDGIEVSCLYPANIKKITLLLGYNGKVTEIDSYVILPIRFIHRFASFPIPIYLFDVAIKIEYNDDYEVETNHCSILYSLIREEYKKKISEKLADKLNEL